MTRRPAALALIAVAIVLLAAAGAWSVLRPRSPTERLAAARDLVAAVRVSAAAGEASLLAASAIADFGVGNDVRLVRVRIVDQVTLHLRIETSSDVGLAAPLRLCLVGPYSAPDDAGLSDRCWGTPDLGAVVTDRLATDPAGRAILPAAQPTDVSVVLRRGDVRCDYAPGSWRLEVSLEPMIDGAAAGPVDLADVSLAVPFDAAGALQVAGSARYCGLAESIVREQGEPVVVRP